MYNIDIIGGLVFLTQQEVIGHVFPQFIGVPVKLIVFVFIHYLYL